MGNGLKCDIAVIGAGVLGVTTAYWLTELYDCSVTLLDKEEDVAQHATTRNTGLVHRPFYLDPITKRLFARCAEKSYHMWKSLAARFGLPWSEVGTLLVATSEQQVKKLEEYQRWGVENGMEEGECQLMDSGGAKELEPSVSCCGAIVSNRDASTDYAALTRAVSRLAFENGARFLPMAEVTRIEVTEGKAEIQMADGRVVRSSLVINAAGGNALKLARRMGLAGSYAILHFRGEYWKVDTTRGPRSTRNIYSVPRHPEFPFLDPHYIARADGTKEVGPNAVLASGPEAYERSGMARALLGAATERPLVPKARLFSNGTFISLAMEEWRSSASKDGMCERVQRFIPAMTPEMLVSRGMAGVRSSLVDKSGFVPEAVVIEDSNSLHVLNYNSPGATGAPVFAAHIVRRLQNEGSLEGFRARQKSQAFWDFDDTQID